MNMALRVVLLKLILAGVRGRRRGTMYRPGDLTVRMITEMHTNRVYV